LPLAEWRSVREHPAAILFENVPPTTLVISYHDNSDYFLFLEPAEDRFTWFDPHSPENSTSAGATLKDFLKWWWDYAQELDPRDED
jgi:hypothetical protein